MAALPSPPASVVHDSFAFAHHPHYQPHVMHTVLASASHILSQPPPPTLREILSAYKMNGDGDRDMLLALLGAKTAEDQRLAETASLHARMLDAQVSGTNSPPPPPPAHRLVSPPFSPSSRTLPPLSQTSYARAEPMQAPYRKRSRSRSPDSPREAHRPSHSPRQHPYAVPPPSSRRSTSPFAYLRSSRTDMPPGDGQRASTVERRDRRSS